MPTSDAMVAHAAKASDTVSFILIIAVMATLLIRILMATSPSLTEFKENL